MNDWEQKKCLEIYERNKVRVYRYLRKHYPGLAEDDIFDIMQDVWAALSKHIHTVCLKSEVVQGAWLYRVCIAKTSDLFRKRNKATKLNRKMKEATKREYSQDPVPDAVMNKLEALDILNGLTERERKIFLNTFLEDIENETNKNAATCKVYRIRKKIEKKMGIRKEKNGGKNK